MKRLFLVMMIISTGYSKKIKTTQFDVKKSYKIVEATQKGNIILEDRVTRYFYNDYYDFDMEKLLNQKVDYSGIETKSGYVLRSESTYNNPGISHDYYDKTFNKQGLLVEEGQRESIDKVGKWKYIKYLFEKTDEEGIYIVRKFEAEVTYIKAKYDSEIVSVENTGNPNVYYDAEYDRWRYEGELYTDWRL